MKLPGFRPVQRIWALWSVVGPGGRHEAGAPESTDQPHATAAPRHPDPVVVRCLHCDVPIRPWNPPWWVHTGPAGTFQCRGEHGILHDDRYATPPHPRRTAVGTYPAELISGITFDHDTAT